MTAQEWLGVAGFVLSLVNAWQTWRRRPIVSLLPSVLQAEQGAKLLIEIKNRYNRPITLTDRGFGRVTNLIRLRRSTAHPMLRTIKK